MNSVILCLQFPSLLAKYDKHVMDPDSLGILMMVHKVSNLDQMGREMIHFLWHNKRLVENKQKVAIKRLLHRCAYIWVDQQIFKIY